MKMNSKKGNDDSAGIAKSTDVSTAELLLSGPCSFKNRLCEDERDRYDVDGFFNVKS